MLKINQIFNETQAYKINYLTVRPSIQIFKDPES